jgi:hypothetical protein
MCLAVERIERRLKGERREARGETQTRGGLGADKTVGLRASEIEDVELPEVKEAANAAGKGQHPTVREATDEAEGGHPRACHRHVQRDVFEKARDEEERHKDGRELDLRGARAWVYAGERTERCTLHAWESCRAFCGARCSGGHAARSSTV